MITPLDTMLQAYQRRVDSLTSEVLLLRALLNEERDGCSRRCVGDGCSDYLSDGRLLSGWSICARCEQAVRRGKLVAGPDSRIHKVCKHGHQFTPENTYVFPNGDRECRICHRDREHRYKAKKRAGLQPNMSLLSTLAGIPESVGLTTARSAHG